MPSPKAVPDLRGAAIGMMISKGTIGEGRRASPLSPFGPGATALATEEGLADDHSLA